MINNKWSKCLLVIALMWQFPSIISAQLTVDYSMTPDEIAQSLVGVGVDIYNVQVTAADSSYGYYYSNNTPLGNSEGLLLTTGRAHNAIGPNDETGLPIIDSLGNCVNCDKYDNFFPGSQLLSDANGGLSTWDACTFEFDVVAQGDSVKFDFAFASEEYKEWVGSSFNDVFGFFVTGPGIGVDVNIALIQGTSTPVAINSVNHIDNTQYFYDNEDPLGLDVQYDGITQGIRAEVGNVVPCEVYHFKLIIADGSDRIYDSGVFISKLKSNPVSLLSSTAGGVDYMIEGCNQGNLTFESTFVPTSPYEVNFSLGGTAVLGSDFTTTPDITPTYDPFADTYSISIPAGDSIFNLGINTIYDGIDEPINFINFTLVEQLCDTILFQSSLDFYIIDQLTVNIDPPSSDICPGECQTLTTDVLTDGLSTFYWSPTVGMNDSTSTSPEVCPPTSTSYVITSEISDCIAQDTAQVNITVIDLSFDITNNTCSNGGTGQLTANPSSGVPPYSYSWSGPNGISDTTQTITDLAPGIYCVLVTDANGCTVEGCESIITANPLIIDNVIISDYLCHAISCFGACDGEITVSVSGGFGSYTFAWTGPSGFTSTNATITGLCPGQYNLIVTDDAGCEVSYTTILSEPDPLDTQLDGVVDVLCNGEQTGSACVTSTGGCAPYFYSWSHDANLISPCALELPSDTFFVSVSDVNGCTATDSVVIVIGGPGLPITANIDAISVYPGGYNVSCPDASDGSVDITVSGGTPGYFIQWIHQESGDTYFTEDLTNVACGTYDLYISDGNNCDYTDQVVLTCVPDITSNATITPNPCSSPNAGIGAIDIIVGGGNGGAYTFTWNGPSCAPCITQNISGLNSGDYDLVITDAQGCPRNFTYNVGTNDSFTLTETIVDATCYGAFDGSIDLVVNPVGAYTFDWVGPNGFIASSQNISGLEAGDYEVTISTALCTETFMFTVGEPNAIIISEVNVSPPTCFGQNNGSIEIAVNGGTGIIGVNWPAQPSCFFAGSTSTSINNLFDCEYTVIATDAAGCTATDTISLEAPQVMDIFVDVTQFDGGYNLSCNGENDGIISVTVTGGTPDCAGFSPYCYTYDWGNCDAVPNPGSNVQSNLGAGTYCVVVTDSAGCVATTQIPMIEPDPIDGNAVLSDYNGFNISCEGSNDGWISPNVVGGSGNYSLYQWVIGDIGSNNPLADTLTDLGPGSYGLFIMDTNGCTDTSLYELFEPDSIIISIDNVQNITCYGDMNGVIAVSASGGSGGYTYDWSGPGGPYAGNLITALGAGVYDLTVTDLNGCTQFASVEIIEPDPFQVTLDIPVQGDSVLYTLQCFGDMTGAIYSDVAGGFPGYTYEWQDAGLNPIGTDPDISGLGAGSYCVIVTDSIGCVTQSCAVITEPPVPFVVDVDVSVYGAGDNISCFNACDGWIELSASGGVSPYTYLWNIPGVDSVLTTDQNLYDICFGSYEVLVTDANGCDTLIFLELTQPSQILSNGQLSSYIGGYNISCAGACDGNICIAPSGGYSQYTLDWVEASSSDTCLYDLCAGVQTLNITDSIGCMVTEIFNLTEPDSILFNPTIQNVTCFGAMDGSIAAGISGGNGDYTIAWTPNVGATDTIVNLSPDNYCIDVIDTNGCTAAACWDITEPEDLDATAIVTNADCGLCNGIIELTVAGGTPDYTYNWTGQDVTQNDSIQTELCAGLYSVTVLDTNLCSVTLDLEVEGPDPINAVADIIDPLCFESCDGSISIVVSNAIVPYTATWTDVAGTLVGQGDDLEDICNGNFSVEIVDANGCSNSFVFGVTEPDSITINGFSPVYPNGYNVSSFGGNNGEISTNVSGGTAGYQYDWSGPSNIDDNQTGSNGLSAGDYLLMITDSNGCIKDTVIVLTAPFDLTLPTGLSPNGDGSNDNYVILGIEEYPNNIFRVYNRWGNLVYEKNNYMNEWNGRNNDNADLPDGTYFVVFEAGTRSFNSYVDLRR